MDRLTEKAPGCFGYALKNHMAEPGEFGTYDAYFDYSEAVQRLGQYEDTGLEPDRIKEFMAKWVKIVELADFMNQAGIAHLRDLLRAEQDGRLVVLPCKVGASIFRLGVNEVLDFWNVEHADVYEDEVVIVDDSYNCFTADDIGKSVFLTSEEAEAAMEAQKGGEG